MIFLMLLKFLRLFLYERKEENKADFSKEKLRSHKITTYRVNQHIFKIKQPSKSFVLNNL
jgi:hypothetical protein